MGEHARQIHDYLLKLIEAFKKFSIREKILIFSAIALAVFWVIYHGAAAVVKVFQEQQQTLAEVERQQKNLPSRLERLAVLQSRKEAIEKAYHQVEISEGAKSHLESLLLSKESIFKDRFTIDDKEPKRFGGNYQQTAFKLKFRITKFDELIDLLKQMAKGEKPVMLKRIDIQKSIRGDRLDVELDVISISRIKT